MNRYKYKGGAIEDTSIAYARKILDWIKKHQHTEITARTVQQNVRPKTNIENVKSTLAILCDHDYLYNIDPKYLVNPEIL